MSHTAAGSRSARSPVGQLDRRGQRPRADDLALDRSGVADRGLLEGVEILAEERHAPGASRGPAQPRTASRRAWSPARGRSTTAASSPPVRPIMSAPGPRAGSSATWTKSGSSPATIRAVSSARRAREGARPTWPTPGATGSASRADSGRSRDGCGRPWRSRHPRAVVEDDGLARRRARGSARPARRRAGRRRGGRAPAPAAPWARTWASTATGSVPERRPGPDRPDALDHVDVEQLGRADAARCACDVDVDHVSRGAVARRDAAG